MPPSTTRDPPVFVNFEILANPFAVGKVQPAEDLPPKQHIDFLAPFRVLFSKQAAFIIGFLAIYYAVWQMSITVMSTLFASIYHLNETEIGLTFIANGA